MNKRALEGYRQRLRQLADRMQSDASAVSEQARGASGGQGAGELSNAPMHLGDMGTEEFLQDINATLLENEEYLVNEAREALRRIDTGHYGQCEECGQPIPRERLDALPYARFCTTCAEAVGLWGSLRQANSPHETVVNRSTRPASENLVPPRTLSDIGSREGVRAGKAQRGTADHPADIYAAGTPGGGSAIGGLAGSNAGSGDPDLDELEQAMGSSTFDQFGPPDEPEDTPEVGRAGGAVGGSPVGKRTRGKRPPAKG